MKPSLCFSSDHFKCHCRRGIFLVKNRPFSLRSDTITRRRRQRLCCSSFFWQSSGLADGYYYCSVNRDSSSKQYAVLVGGSSKLTSNRRVYRIYKRWRWGGEIEFPSKQDMAVVIKGFEERALLNRRSLKWNASS